MRIQPFDHLHTPVSVRAWYTAGIKYSAKGGVRKGSVPLSMGFDIFFIIPFVFIAIVVIGIIVTVSLRSYEGHKFTDG